MNLFKKMLTAKFFQNKIKLKIFAILLIVSAFFGAGYLFVQAQFVADDFTTTDKVADTWNVEVDTGTGAVKLATRTCDLDVWYCNASTTCANTLGDGDYIIVAKADAGTTKTWKNTLTACDRPQCGTDGGQDGDNMVADNTITFGATYPAREYCKTIGGRLPTLTELQCIYTNRASFGTFQSNRYWSATENSTTSARDVHFGTGSVYSYNKTSSYYVRCVFGQ